MGKSKPAGENSKKAAGNARKAESAAKKQAEINAKESAAEEEYWSQGSKGKNAKKEADTAKKEEAARKKAERDAELEAETSAAAKKKPVLSQKKAGGAKAAAAARSSGLDAALAASTESGTSTGSDLYAHNIDDAISALELTSGKSSDKIDRHPERRFKAALRAYEERRLPEIREEHKGLRLNQYQQRIYEEFQKSPENPFNQVKASYNASRAEVAETAEAVRQSKEERLKH